MTDFLIKMKKGGLFSTIAREAREIFLALKEEDFLDVFLCIIAREARFFQIDDDEKARFIRDLLVKITNTYFGQSLSIDRLIAGTI
jgi:hypothetical protein